MTAHTDRVMGGRYQLERLLGAGAMGSVWEAEDQSLQRKVAVKLVAEVHRDDDAAAARFEREARVAAQLVHPNLATVFDYGQDDGELYMVLELLEGETLADRIRQGPLPADEVAALGAEVADGLAAVHAGGIVHRDVKPANIMLTPRGAKLMDFGIATGLGDPLTATGDVIGTAAYLAPERVRGEEAGPPSDVYALGAVLYEAASGVRAFRGPTTAEVAMAHLTTTPEPLEDVVAGVPGTLADACRGALEADPQHRPTAAVLASRLGSGDSEAAGATTAIVGPDRTMPLPMVAAAVGAPAGEVSPVPADQQPRARPPAGVLVVGGVIVLLLIGSIAWALGGSGDGDGAGPDPAAAETTAAPSTTAPSTTAPPTTAPPTTAPPTTAAAAPPPDQGGGSEAQQAADQVEAVLAEGVAAGEIDDRAASAIGREAGKAADASDRGDSGRALEHVDTADSRLQEALEQSDITEDRAAAVASSLDALRAVIDPGGDGGDGDGGDGDGDGDD